MWFDLFGFVLACALFLVGCFSHGVRPARGYRWTFAIFGLLALAPGFARISVYPAVLPIPTAGLVVLLIAIAVLPPVLGLLEARAKPMSPIYSKDRFREHLFMNLIGAALAGTLLVLARDPGKNLKVAERFTNDYSLNVFLILSVMVSAMLIRTQQMKSCATEVEALSRDRLSALPEGASDLAVLKWVMMKPDVLPEVSNCYEEDSLVRWHQLGNLVHLTFAVFMGTTSLMYLLVEAMIAARDGDPLDLPVAVLLVLALGLGFILACGNRRVNKGVRSIYVMFQTGTPAVLCGTILWLSLYERSELRNVAAFSLVTLGYIIYVGTLTVDLARHGEKVEPYHYASLVIAMVLAILLAGMYLTPIS